MDDISAIVEAENLDQFFLFGLSEGAAISLVYAATHTNKVKSVAVFGGTAKFTKADDYKFVPEYEVMVENMLKVDAKEGIDAFINKRQPKWKDK